MKVFVVQQDLKRALSIVTRAVPSKSSMPILSTILFSIEEGTNVLTLEATDLNKAIRYTIPCSCSDYRNPKIAIPAKLLNDLVNNLPAEGITIATDENHKATITSASGKIVSDINGLSASDFPDIPYDMSNKIAIVNAVALKHALQQVSVAASSEDGRPVLQGVFMQFPQKENGNQMTMSAADGYRLATRKLEMREQFMQDGCDVIIPAEALQELSRLLMFATDAVTISLNNNHMGFEVTTNDGDSLLLSRTIDGKYPDIERVIPTTNPIEVTVNRVNFAKAVKVARLFASTNILRIIVNPILGIELQSNGDGKGNNSSKIDADVLGDGTTIALNVTFVEDALNVIDTENVTIYMNTAQNPAIFVPHGIEPTYKHVIMPMMVR